MPAATAALRSMTGFGAASLAEGALSVRVEVRTVNHRHLQLKCRLPAELAALESEVDALVRKRVARGSVALFAQVERAATLHDVSFDEVLAKRFADRLRRLARAAGASDDVGLSHLIGLPGVVVETEADPRDEKTRRLLMRTVRAALEELVTMREDEGSRMARELAKLGEAIARLVARIDKRMPGVVKRHGTALRKRAGELLDRTEALPAGDLARELALLADRLDVREEVARLESHLEQLRSTLAKGGVVGRQLDFLAQEFFREANTIGAKCSDAKVAHLVVELKTAIERLREQVQNVE